MLKTHNHDWPQFHIGEAPKSTIRLFTNGFISLKDLSLKHEEQCSLLQPKFWALIQTHIKSLYLGLR